ncbi:hypothetical protein [Listeria phage LMTA-57]|uniref:Uncharacterized protein n=3 Tax=Pecentumvirus TaxID=1857844 RepID=A0A060ABZ1_9CAUD|nr:hypothetical protein HH39_gp027 [Listeria phage LMSP-25]YP_009616131.1 hypothetical protein FDI77_gp028 [Listeria phage LMTA-34]YP_009793324.1 hypothetical protein QLX42_gp021 [Listeria phage LMTA-57]AIA64370.1 hypothetical protein [Listeria phage LMSP-25]AID16929.1 hypothetical protein [Listeria phage LMTA-34]AID17475.1 hypothetical protein [Listeria phage LMTA-57]
MTKTDIILKKGKVNLAHTKGTFEASGYTFEYGGFSLFVRKLGKRWSVSEVTTGRELSLYSVDTREKAVDRVCRLVDNHRQVVQKAVDKAEKI